MSSALLFHSYLRVRSTTLRTAPLMMRPEQPPGSDVPRMAVALEAFDPYKKVRFF